MRRPTRTISRMIECLKNQSSLIISFSMTSKRDPFEHNSVTMYSHWSCGLTAIPTKCWRFTCSTVFICRIKDIYICSLPRRFDELCTILPAQALQRALLSEVSFVPTRPPSRQASPCRLQIFRRHRRSHFWLFGRRIGFATTSIMLSNYPVSILRLYI